MASFSSREWVAGLTFTQRLRRRVSLWSGSYTHPDGRIELDFHEPSGIRPDDCEEVQGQKLRAYHERKHERKVAVSRMLGAAILGWVTFLVLEHFQVPLWDRAGLGMLSAYGTWLISQR